jgi:hypothetical protein
MAALNVNVKKDPLRVVLNHAPIHVHMVTEKITRVAVLVNAEKMHVRTLNVHMVKFVKKRQDLVRATPTVPLKGCAPKKVQKKDVE